jgi:hypothetical protein
MKLLLAVLFVLLLPSIPFAQGGKYFSSPFDVHLKVQGEFEHHNNGYIDMVSHQFDAVIRLDPNNSATSIIRDDTICYGTGSDSLFFVFNSARTVLTKFGWWNHVYGYSGSVWHFFSNNLTIDTDSTHLDSSELSKHEVDVVYSAGYAYTTNHGSFSNYYILTKPKTVDFSLLSSALSVPSAISVSDLNFVVNQTMHECRFASSSKERTLDLFSLFGSRIFSNNIPPGSTSVTIPHLPCGLYFIRLGESVIKAYIGE